MAHSVHKCHQKNENGNTITSVKFLDYEWDKVWIGQNSLGSNPTVAFIGQMLLVS